MEADVEYLCFSPGGVYGFAHVGVLQELEEVWARGGRNFHRCIRGAAGSSIGSVVALAVVLGYRGIELQQIATDELAGAADELEAANLVHLYNTMGMLSPKPLDDFVGKLLTRKLGRDDVTFAELATLFPDCALVVAAHSVEGNRSELFSAETTPGIEVRRACVWSCSIPIIFEPGRHSDGRLYVDGGLSNSLPYDLFPLDRTLAVYLVKAPRQPPLMQLEKRRFVNYISLLIDAYETATRVRLDRDRPRHLIRVGMPTKTLSTLVVDPAEQLGLVALGRINVLLYLHPRITVGLNAVLTATRAQTAPTPGTADERGAAAPPRTSPPPPPPPRT